MYPLVFIAVKYSTVRGVEGLLQAYYMQGFGKITACDHGQVIDKLVNKWMSVRKMDESHTSVKKVRVMRPHRMLPAVLW